jgi:hypothetical protein
MDDRKITNNSDTSCSCRNGYTTTEMFLESFANDDESVNKCNGCPAFTYTGGIAGCKKFD